VVIEHQNFEVGLLTTEIYTAKSTFIEMSLEILKIKPAKIRQDGQTGALALVSPFWAS